MFSSFVKYDSETSDWQRCIIMRHNLIQFKMTRRRGLTNEGMKKKIEESDDEDIDLDDGIDDPDFQDAAHNLQHSSDSDDARDENHEISC
ncbi:hypothetical protein TNCT_369391 [Trichonephila clavata]|uniref:Uncharacterized protein n=1 Tax=Trichonephila clavata TaxID=2740835 RepID=A0A8X6L3V6_TRICU|nr:hypothetical protein TNCT_369391 [Trichonephila clavata]